MLPVGNAIRYVLPASWMTSWFHMTKRMGRIKDDAYVWWSGGTVISTDRCCSLVEYWCVPTECSDAGAVPAAEAPRRRSDRTDHIEACWIVSRRNSDVAARRTLKSRSICHKQQSHKSCSVAFDIQNKAWMDSFHAESNVNKSVERENMADRKEAYTGCATKKQSLKFFFYFSSGSTDLSQTF